MWYYAENNQQRGPVSEAEFQALIQAGTIKPETLVWRDGMANWQPYNEVKALAGGTLPIPPLAPAPFATQSNAGGATEAQVRERDYEHDIGGYINRAWQLVQSDMGGIIGATTMVGFCLMLVNGIPYLNIAGIILTGPLLGGLFVFFLKKVRSQTAELGDAFSGFGPRFGQLFVAKIVPGLLAAVALIPAAIIFVIAIITGALPISHGGGQFVLSGIVVAAIALGAVGVCVAMYLQTCWLFTLWLVADKNMAFWPAMQLSRAVVRKHWWQTFFLGIVAGVIVMLGVLLCFVGLLVTAPIGVAMYAFAYEKLFGDMQSAE